MGANPSALFELRFLDEVQHTVLVYIPSFFFLFLILGPLILYLWVPILASTSMLPSAIQCHTSKIVGAIERCASLCPSPFPMAVLIQT
jgi:hypothetical protein